MSAGGERVPVYVWDLTVRLTHWIVAASIVVLSVTGFYIGRPFIVAPGPATEVFIMGWMKIVHFYAAVAFTGAVLARVIWMFAGPQLVSWRQFVPTTRARLRHMWDTFKFYIFIRAEPPPSVGHNALAGAAYLAIFGLYFIMIFTGWGIYAASSGVGSLSRVFLPFVGLLGGLQSSRWIHHVGMWLLLGFVIQHVYSSILMSKIEKTGTMDSIFGGWKIVPRALVPRTPTEKRHG
jgi:Ni/Fe-hydrogenase 1 B-type cytochrome subunit